MPVRKLSSISDYIGLSTDIKPPAEYGATFFETDTQKQFVLNAQNEWALQGGVPVSGEGNTILQFGDSPSIDAFGRMRVADPNTLFDSKMLWDKQPLIWDEEITNGSGNATSTHSVTDSRVRMHVEAGDTIIRQTFMRFNYQPGKSQQAMFTGVIGVDLASISAG